MVIYKSIFFEFGNGYIVLIMLNFKFQVPSSKFQTNSKSQWPKFETWRISFSLIQRYPKTLLNKGFVISNRCQIYRNHHFIPRYVNMSTSDRKHINSIKNDEVQGYIIQLLGRGRKMTTKEIIASAESDGLTCPDEPVRFLNKLRIKGEIKGEVSLKHKGWVWWV